MNIAITAVFVAVFSVLGFCVGCFACLSKIEKLEYENKTLTEWLEVSRKTNEKILKEYDEILLDLEAAINGKSLMRNEEETKID